MLAYELRYFFTMKTNLAAAIRRAEKDDIEFHLSEFEALQLNTENERLRRACAAVIAAHTAPFGLVSA
jgi:hypothetical protein